MINIFRKNVGVLKKRGRPAKLQSQSSQHLLGDANDAESLRNKLLEMSNLANIPDLPHKWSPHLKELDPLICDYIEMYENVEGDGHCGYRSIAFLRGYDLKEGWRLVREELLKEMLAHPWEYKAAFGENDFMDHKRNLECKTPRCGPIDYFDLPNMGSVVANAYNCVFVVLALGSASTTYLPLRTVPPVEDYGIMTIGHIDRSTHFVPLRLSLDAPLPPLVPGWKKIIVKVAEGWFQLIQARLERYKQEITAPLIGRFKVPRELEGYENNRIYLSDSE